MRMKAFGVVQPSSDVFAVVFAIKRSDRKKSPLAHFLRLSTDLWEATLCLRLHKFAQKFGKTDEILNVTLVRPKDDFLKFWSNICTLLHIWSNICTMQVHLLFKAQASSNFFPPNFSALK